MSLIRPRCGATVAELAVALLIAGSAAAVGAGLLLAAERRSRRDGHDSISAQTTREVMHILAAEIGSARWGSAVVRGDTALDLDAHVGVSVACAGTDRVLILPPSRTTLAEPWTSWRYPPEAGDIAFVWDSSGAWRVATIDSATSSHSDSCAAGGAFRSLADSLNAEPLTRLRLSDPIAVAAGAPVRVFRATRWMIYRGGDRRWWLGQRRCLAGSCGAAQPVAGPLAPPGLDGLRFSSGADGRVDVFVRPDGALTPASVANVELTIRGAGRVAR